MSGNNLFACVLGIVIVVGVVCQGCASRASVGVPGVGAAQEPSAPQRVGSYRLEFSTYLGGGKWDMSRGSCVDAEGDIYVAGGTASPDFPTTEGALCRTYVGNTCNAFVAKFAPDGRLIWSTLLGGKGYDRAYAVKLDKDGYIYVCGRAAPGFPTTPGSFQPDFRGSAPEGIYGQQDGFVAKLTPGGDKIVWASYVGLGVECRDMALDDEGNIYLTLPYQGLSKSTLPEEWFANAYRKSPNGKQDCGLIKVANDGSKVLWATYVGGTGVNMADASMCVGADHCPVLFIGTQSKDLPVTPGVYTQSVEGTWNSWLGKLSPDGSKLVWGLYIGDGNMSIPRTHDASQDSQGNIFIATGTHGRWPVTPGAFQTKFGGGSDFGIAKFSPTGQLLAATFLGGGGDEFNGPDTVFADDHGNVLIVGYTNSPDYPVTPGAFQSKCGGQFDGVVTLLSGDLSRLLYSTYMGGSMNDNVRTGSVGRDGSLCVAGASASPNWPLKNAYQSALRIPVHKPDVQDWGSGNVIVARFSRQSGLTCSATRPSDKKE